ncbi:MAG: ParB/RepB/Spo0J family partition protein [Alphaproteobacteria bacterium]
MRQIELPLSKLVLSSLNVRKDLDAGQEDSGIEELAQSIREKGLIQALLVRPLPNGNYEVIAGQRRLLACKRIGFEPVPCRERDNLSDTDAVTISLIENVQRADMNPLDKAQGLKTLYDDFKSYDRVGREVSLSASTVRKYVRLLSLPEEIQERISTSAGAMSISALSQLAQNFSDDEAVEAYEEIAAFNSRIQTEILRRSNGDIARVRNLAIEAQEGAFDVVRCGGSYGCDVIQRLLTGEISRADFQQMVRDAADQADSNMSATALKSAAREFWKALARD